MVRGAFSARTRAMEMTASGGETIAPRTKAGPHAKPGMAACAVAATAAMVAATRPTASSVTERR
jgi:hypothetical protein